MSVKETFASLSKDKKALIDAFGQLYFLSRRQREIVANSAVKEINNYVRDKSEEMEIINEITAQIQKKLDYIRTEGRDADKSDAKEFALSLQKECQDIIEKIMSVESSDREFILKTRESLGKEVGQIDDTRVKLKKIKISYAAGDGVKFFDRRG